MARLISARRSGIHGKGVFALQDIPKGTTLCEYIGKQLTHAEADAKYAGNVGTGHTFLFTLNDDYIIDANQGGGVARWINHSCKPNAKAWVIEHESGDPKKDRVMIEAKRDIKKGEEITYNYGIVLDLPYTKELKALWPCHCGAKNCTGTLLQPKEEEKGKKGKEGKKKDRKKGKTGEKGEKGKDGKKKDRKKGKGRKKS